MDEPLNFIPLENHQIFASGTFSDYLLYFKDSYFWIDIISKDHNYILQTKGGFKKALDAIIEANLLDMRDLKKVIDLYKE